MSQDRQPSTASEFFEDSPAGLAIFEAVASVVSAFGPVKVQVSKSQITFRRRRGFAYLWRPGQYVKSLVPAVLSLALPRELESPRFKEIAHPTTKVWMHHLELHDTSMIDPEVTGWLREGYDSAA